MENVPLSFREWCYPTKHKRNINCSWGNCGYIAISHKNIITIYKFDGIKYTTFLSWSPYDTAEITAMGWLDGSCAPCESIPILAVSFTNGSTLFFNLDDQVLIAKMKHNNQIVKVIKWSPYNPNELFIGTDDGQLSICEMLIGNENTTIKIREKIPLGFPIDFISIDKLNGSTIVAASRKGKIAYITDLYQLKKSRSTNPLKPNENFLSRITQYVVKRSLNFQESKQNTLNSIEFLPGQYLYLIISTNNSSYIYLLNDDISIPFITSKDIKYIYPLFSKNYFIAILKNSIELWSYQYDNLNPTGDLKMLYSIGIQTSGHSGVECFNFLNDELVVFTKSSWLTLISEKKKKLFVTQRNRMMPPKPIDWDFKDSQIAFLTSDGQILLTEKVDNINHIKDIPKRDTLHFYTPPSLLPQQVEEQSSTANNQVSSEKVPSFSNPTDSSELRTAFDPSAIKVSGANNLNRKRAQSFQTDKNKAKSGDNEFSTAAMDPKEAKKKSRKDSNVKEAPKKSGGGFFGFFKGKNKDKTKTKKKKDEFEPEGDTLFDLDEDNDNDATHNQQQQQNQPEDDEIDTDDELMDAFDKELSPQKGKSVSHSTSNSSLNSASNIPLGTTQTENTDEIEFFCSHSPTQAIKMNNIIQPQKDAKVGCSMSFSSSFTTDPNRIHFDSHLYFSHIYNTVQSHVVTTITINEENKDEKDDNEDENTKENEQGNENDTSKDNNQKEKETTDEKKDNPNMTVIGALDVSINVNDYLITPNWKLNVHHLKFITKNKILAWGTCEGKNNLILINIKKRKVINLMQEQLESINKPISDIKFSKDMNIAFITFGDEYAAFFRLTKPYQWIGAIKLRQGSVGDFSPDYLRTDFFDNVNAIDEDEDDNNEDQENITENEEPREKSQIDIDFGLGKANTKSKVDLKKVYLAAFLSECLTITVVKINKSLKTPIKIVFERTIKISKASPSSFLWKGRIDRANTPSLYHKKNSEIEQLKNNKFYMFLGSKEGRLFSIEFTETFNIIRPDDKNVNANDIVIKQLASVGGGAITTISPLLFPDRSSDEDIEKSRESIITSYENLSDITTKQQPHKAEEKEKEEENSDDLKETEKVEPIQLELIDNFFLLTNSGQAFMVKNGKQFELKSKIKNAKFATDLTMLCRFARSGSLTRVEYVSSPRSIFIKASSKLLNSYDRRVSLDQVVGDGSYSLPPVTFLSKTNFVSDVKRQKNIEDMVRVCRLYGQNYVGHALDMIINNHANLQYLTDFWFLNYLNKTRFYSGQLFKSSLFASKLDLAHSILLDTKPENPNFILNLTRASFFDMPILLEKARQQLIEANEEYERMKKKDKEIKKKLQRKKKFILVNKNKEITKVDENGNEITETVTVEEEEEINEEEDNEKKTIDEVLEIDSVIIENVKNSKKAVQLFGNKMEIALKAMISNKKYEDAVETLLIIGQVSRAVELLLDLPDVREAALLSSMWPLAPFTLIKVNQFNDEEEEEDHEDDKLDCKKLMIQVAEKFCNEGGFLLAISLLTGAGMNKEAIELVTKYVEAFPRLIKGIHINNLENFDEGSADDSDDVNDWV